MQSEQALQSRQGIQAGKVRRQRLRAEIPTAQCHGGQQHHDDERAEHRQNRGRRRSCTPRRGMPPSNPCCAARSHRSTVTLRIICDRCAATVPPIATSAALPPIMVAKLVSSRERGIWPRSRASCRRRCEGSSVRSPPISDSAIRAPPRRERRPMPKPPASALLMRVAMPDMMPSSPASSTKKPLMQRNGEADAE